MMEKKVVLCADTESIKNPYIVGLEGEHLESQDWLRVFCSAVEARAHLSQSTSDCEVWVASSDDVDAINLAAALKKDSVTRQVYLLAFQGSGSLKSRASAAGLDATLSQQDFVRRYAQFKQMSFASADFAGNNSKERSDYLNRFDASKKLQAPIQENPSQLFRAQSGGKAIQANSAHVLSVVSASGGSGKSTVAVLSALLSQSLGFNTLLLDMDMQFGDMKFFLGEEDPLTIDKVLADKQLVMQLKPKGSRPALLAAPAKLEQSELLTARIPELIDCLKSSFEVIIVNTGAFWTDQHIALLERSTTGLFIVDQHASSIRACKHALDLCARCGIAASPFLFAINHCARNAPFTSIDVSCALQGAHVVELQEGGREVADLLGAGMPHDLVEGKNDLCQSIEKMLLDVLPKTEATAERLQQKSEGKRFRISRKRRRVACL